MMQMVGGGGEPPLPADYQRLQYVIGTGGGNYSRTQECNIGVYGNAVYEFSSRVKLQSNVHQWYSILMAKENNNYILYFQGGVCYYRGTQLGTPVVTSGGSDMEFSIVVNSNSVVYTRSGVEYTKTNVTSLNNCDGVFVFRMSNLNGGTAEFYDTFVKRDGITIAHFIPCKRISDSVCGFYEVFTGTFLYSTSGTAWAAGTVLT